MKKNEKSQRNVIKKKICGAMFRESVKKKHLENQNSTSLHLKRELQMYLYLYNVVQQLQKGSKKVDRTYIGSLVQTHLSWDATSQSQSSLRSKSELVLLLNRRSRWCMQRTMWTVLVSNTGMNRSDCIARQGNTRTFNQHRKISQVTDIQKTLYIYVAYNPCNDVFKMN